MRVPDGRIFDVAAPAAAYEPVPKPSIDVIPPPPDEPTVVDVEPATAAVKPPAPEPEAATAEPAPDSDAATTPRRPGSLPKHEPEPVTTAPLSPPVDPEPLADATPVRHSGRLVAALAGAIVVLALGFVVPWDSDGRSLVTPHFGPLKDSTGGLLTVLSPLAVVLVAAVATVMAARGRRLQLAAGLLIACGIAATAKYLGVLGRAVDPGFGQHAEPVSVLVFCLVVASSLALILIGIQLAQAAGTRLGRDATSDRATGLMLGAAGFLSLAGCLRALQHRRHRLAFARRRPGRGSVLVRRRRRRARSAGRCALRPLPAAMACGRDGARARDRKRRALAQVHRRARRAVERRGRVRDRRRARAGRCGARPRGRASALDSRGREDPTHRTCTRSPTHIGFRFGADTSHLAT